MSFFWKHSDQEIRIFISWNHKKLVKKYELKILKSVFIIFSRSQNPWRVWNSGNQFYRIFCSQVFMKKPTFLIHFYHLGFYMGLFAILWIFTKLDIFVKVLVKYRFWIVFEAHAIIIELIIILIMWLIWR